MIQFQPILLLIPYALFLFFYAVLALINIFHIFKFGATTKVSVVATAMFLAGIATVSAFTFLALNSFDWSAPVPLF